MLFDWRWCFKLMTILVGLNTVVLIWGMDETYAEYVSLLVHAVFDLLSLGRRDERGYRADPLKQSGEISDRADRSSTANDRGSIEEMVGYGSESCGEGGDHSNFHCSSILFSLPSFPFLSPRAIDADSTFTRQRPPRMLANPVCLIFILCSYFSPF